MNDKIKETIKTIEAAVIKFYNLKEDPEELKTPSRKGHFVKIRVVTGFISVYTYSVSFTEFAKYYNRDHSTYCKMLHNLSCELDRNAKYQEEITTITNQLLS